METKLTERQKQKLCELIEKSLNRVRLQNYKTDDDDNLPLVDMLSNGDTILEGQEEIANIVEQIFFDMDTWDVQLKPVEIPEITDEEVNVFVNSCPGNSGNLIIDKAVESGFKVGAKWYREELKKMTKIEI